MHEFSIAVEIVEVLEKNGYLEGVEYVNIIRLDIGRYSGIDPEYLEFAFQNLGDDRFKGASLDFNQNNSDEIKISEIIVDDNL